MAKHMAQYFFEEELKAENSGEVLRYLTKEGVTPSKEQVQPIFELSIKSYNVDLLRMAIAWGANVKSSTVDGQPPLFYLCRGYRPTTEQMARLLIENKADIAAQYSGNTLLEFANVMSNPPLAKFFSGLLAPQEVAEGPDVACAGAVMKHSPPGGPSLEE